MTPKRFGIISSWAVIRLFNMPLYRRCCGDNDRLSTICVKRNIFP
jgi:hypothetical protein